MCSIVNYCHIHPVKIAFLTFLFLVSTLSFAETPQELARRIISSEASVAHNPVNSTDAELNQAAAINSQLRLRFLMLGNTVSDELRVCYALQVIGRRIEVAQSSKDSERVKQLSHERNLLAAHLRELQKSK